MNWPTVETAHAAVEQLRKNPPNAEDEHITRLAELRMLLWQANREIDAEAVAAQEARTRLARLQLRRDSLRNLAEYMRIHEEFSEKHGPAAAVGALELPPLDEAFWARNPAEAPLRDQLSGRKLAELRINDERNRRLALWREVMAVRDEVKALDDRSYGAKRTAAVFAETDLQNTLHLPSSVARILEATRTVASVVLKASEDVGARFGPREEDSDASEERNQSEDGMDKEHDSEVGSDFGSDGESGSDTGSPSQRPSEAEDEPSRAATDMDES